MTKRRMAEADARYVFGVVITSSSLPIPVAFNANNKAAEPEATPSAEPEAPQDGATATADAGPAKKGDVRKSKDGKEYKWMGALWVDTATNKPIGVQASLQNGLGHPKLDPIIAAAKQDPAVAKAIKAQLTQAA